MSGTEILRIFKEYYPMFFNGMMYTILISLTGTLIGLLIAIIVVPIKIQKVTSRDNTLLRWVKKIGVSIATVYVEVLRGTPMIIQAVIIYYGLVGMGLDLTLDIPHVITIRGIIIYGILIVSINTSAYVTEVLRGSIEAIDKGQMEAARSIGMTRSKAMIHVIIPQAVKNSIPAIGNEFVINIKDTAVLSVIAVTELFFVTRKVNAIYYSPVDGYVIAAGLYLIMTLTTTRLLYYISKRLGRPKTKVTYPTSQSY